MQSLLSLMEAARECRRLYDAANMNVPEPLARLLGEEPSPSASTGAKPRLIVPPPERPSAPAEYRDDWIWIPLSAATATTLVLGVLRGATVPMAAKEVVARVQRVRPDAVGGTIANIGTRLSSTVLRRTDQGWSLEDSSRAPVLFGDFAWGSPDVFGKQELAAHRRQTILHVLRVNPDGLQTTQLLKMLGRCPWLRAPVTKDLVKIDMEELQGDGQVRRIGNTRKWALAK